VATVVGQHRESGIVLGFVVGTATAAIVTMLMGPYSLWSQEAAGWAQAIGTVLAIAGAAWIATSQDRKTQQRQREQQIKTGKSVVACVVPMVKIIEGDLPELLCQYSHVGVPLIVLKKRFRELPSYSPFVLENASLLPGDAIVTVPQLLALRELTASSPTITASNHAPPGAPRSSPDSARAPGGRRDHAPGGCPLII
jgi:hypothetical protein